MTPYNASKDVSFAVHTRRRISLLGHFIGQKITFDQDGIANTFFNSALPTIFIIHGWLNNPDTNYISAIKDAYLERGNYNIVSNQKALFFDSESSKFLFRLW